MDTKLEGAREHCTCTDLQTPEEISAQARMPNI